MKSPVNSNLLLITAALIVFSGCVQQPIDCGTTNILELLSNSSEEAKCFSDASEVCEPATLVASIDILDSKFSVQNELFQQDGQCMLKQTILENSSQSETIGKEIICPYSGKNTITSPSQAPSEETCYGSLKDYYAEKQLADAPQDIRSFNLSYKSKL